MTQDTKRLILASVLIFLVVVLQRPFFEAMGYTTNTDLDNPKESLQELKEKTIVLDDKDKFFDDSLLIDKSENNDLEVYSNDLLKDPIDEININIKTNLYSATISNYSGGTLIKNTLNDHKYIGVILQPFKNLNNCNPCLGYKNSEGAEKYFNELFEYNNELRIDATKEKKTIKFTYDGADGLITKTITFYPNSYEALHEYKIENTTVSDVKLIWKDGLRPTEKNLQDDIINAVGASIKPIGDNKESLRIKAAGASANDDDNNKTIHQAINWIAVQTKYFIAALVPKDASPPVSAKISGKSVDGFNQQKFAQSYDLTMSYNNPSSIIATVYLGPLNKNILTTVNSELDEAIYWGWGPMKPIARFVLWVLNALHSIIPNYGICLILFAFLVQQLTGPLTKKTYKSSQKMQEIQPLVKKIQEKYKDNKQKMNQETMNLYKEKGVNPLGGCLPLLLQMPLLFAIFSVFRHTIELRGTPFVGWINDLSQPDVIFNLPFHIPIYGSHIAFLPILMGISIFLTQRLSMATMDSSQKPMMYIMNGFFILIFNGFPSGLNLYYTVYNLLNYYQQKSIRAKQ